MKLLKGKNKSYTQIGQSFIFSKSSLAKPTRRNKNLENKIGNYDTFEEMRVTNKVENPAAIKLGESPRYNHRGALTNVPNATLIL